MNNRKKFFVVFYIGMLSFFTLFSQVSAGIEWEKTEIDCGKIFYKEPIKLEFNFKNTSMVPLIIENVESTCGCTVTEFPRKPIMPGKSSKIIVTYDAENIGFFKKTVYVYTNTAEKRTVLTFYGEVVKKQK